MILEYRAVAPFFKNGFVIGCEETKEGVVIDPGDEVDDLLSAARTHDLRITMILLTHAHLDHVTGVAKAKRALGVPVWLHRDDNFLYEGVVQQGQMFGLLQSDNPICPLEIFGHHLGRQPCDSICRTNAPRFQGLDRRVRHRPDVIDTPLQGQPSG